VIAETSLRTTGAMLNMTGNATHQEGSHDVIHTVRNPSNIPAVRQVVMPETRSDAMPDNMRAASMGARRDGKIRINQVRFILVQLIPAPVPKGLDEQKWCGQVTMENLTAVSSVIAT